MSSQVKEMLSAVMDGEASEFETRRLFDEAQRSPELRGVWSRYHLIGAALRREGRGGDAQSALDRMWARIDAGYEGGEIDGGRARRLRYVALATSAVVAIVVLGLGIDTGRHPASQAGRDLIATARDAGDVTAEPVNVLDDAANAATFVREVPSESDVARSRAYMLYHAHHVALNPRFAAGGVQYLKVAAYESR